MQNVMEFVFPDTLGVHISDKAKAIGIGLPERRYQGDGGFDLRTLEPVVVAPGTVGKFPTGLNFNIPGHDHGGKVHIALLVLPRTGLASVGGLYPMAWLVDAGFRAQDEDGLVLALRNLGRLTLTFAPGDRVAQGIFIPVWTPVLREISANEVDQTERAGNRFGSTGIR